jgi:hypothetical protein
MTMNTYKLRTYKKRGDRLTEGLLIGREIVQYKGTGREILDLIHEKFGDIALENKGSRALETPKPKRKGRRR